MSDFDTHLSIIKSNRAKDNPYYISKEIELDTIKKEINTPFKIIEGKKINQENIEKSKERNLIFESGIYIDRLKTWKKVYTLLEESGKEQISGLDSLFNIRKNLWDNNSTVVSPVFSKNPFVDNFFKINDTDDYVKVPSLSWDGYEDFLNYVHSASSCIILTPDIRIDEKTVAVDDYINFIDDSVNVLKDWNKKPIFVPIQTDLPKAYKEKILDHYKEQKYTNIWINLKASHIGGTYFTRVRSLVRRIDKKFGLNNVSLYFSHIKKEVGRDVNAEYMVCSNAMSQFFGADFIGINREPRSWRDFNSEEDFNSYIKKKGFENEIEYNKAKLLEKTRLFDQNSYYYYNFDKHPNKSLFDENFVLGNIENNRFLNSILLFDEITKVKNYVSDKKNLKPYIKDKRAFVDDDTLLNNVIPKIKKAIEKHENEKDKPQRDLFSFLGKA